eukprot:jgi/Hompol1/5962/HPOL_004781-RA
MIRQAIHLNECLVKCTNTYRGAGIDKVESTNISDPKSKSVQCPVVNDKMQDGIPIMQNMSAEVEVFGKVALTMA